MPYLKENFRALLEKQGLTDLIHYFVTLKDEDAVGALNYIIFKLVGQRIALQGEKYHRYNGLLGAIGEAQCEIRRRLLTPYEDKKIKEEGDVI